MNTEWVNGHKQTVQKLVNALVKTLRWMSTHSADEIAAKMPADYAQGGKALYAQSIKSTLPMFTKDGVMPENGPKRSRGCSRRSIPTSSPPRSICPGPIRRSS